MTSPQIGREMAAARVDELRRQADHQRAVRAAVPRADRVEVRSTPARPAGWLVRLVAATLRH